MAYLVLFICLLAAGILLVSAAATMPPAQLARIVRYAAGGLLGAGAVFLALTGRLGLAIPLGAVAVALLRGDLAALGGLARSIPGMGRSAPGQRSETQTAWLAMWLDHDSGEMGGTVRQGRFAGQDLETLSGGELAALRGEMAGDADSVRVLDAYLQRMRPDAAGSEGGDGREGAQDNARASGASAGSGGAGGAGATMTREDAYAVLGLSPGASEAEIRRAHRELMQKVHPDHGGSTYLAAQLNRAKDLLLGRR